MRKVRSLLAKLAPVIGVWEHIPGVMLMTLLAFTGMSVVFCVCLLVCPSAVVATAGAADPPAAYARLPAYGAQAAPQPPPPSPLEARLKGLEDGLQAANDKLDRLLKLVEEVTEGPAGREAGEASAALISAATRCDKCHSPDTADKGGGFLLFAFTDKEKTGLAFAALNNFQKQKAVKRIVTVDPALKMPPPPSGPPLTEAEKAALLAVFQDLPKKDGPR